MKNFKLSKTGLLILVAGIFIVVIGVLGITRYNQISEEEDLAKKVSLSAMRVGILDVAPYQSQIAQLQAELESIQLSVEAARTQLIQSVISVDVVEKCYKIAAANNITVEIIGTTQILTKDYEGIPCSMTTVNAKANGPLTLVTDYVASLNDQFTSGVVQSVQMTIDDATLSNYTEASIIMIVYSYEGD